MKTITIEKQDGATAMSEDVGMAVALLRNGTYTVTIKRQRESTASQNALLWMWVNAIARETGDKADDIYKWICHELLPHEVSVMGERVTVDGNPKDLGKAQMSAFLDLVRNWVWQKTGIRLPQPGDRLFDQFKAKYG
jgi:hypothetical protein